MTTRTMERRPNGVPRLLSAIAATALLIAPGIVAAPDRIVRRESPASVRIQTILDSSGNLGAIPSISCANESRTRRVYLRLAESFRKFSEDERCRVATLAMHMMRGQSQLLDDIVAFAESGIGGLEISSDPDGAVIWLNDYRIQGGAGVRVITTTGEKSVRFSHDGFRDETVFTRVEPAEWATVHEDLQRP